jgi:elongation factor P
MDGDDAVFMNQETFDQVTIDKKMIIGEEYMKEGDIVEVVSDASTETILTAEMPVKTVLQITYMEPGAKGNTATNTLTKATVETGGTVLVPLFCKEGDKIVVDTRDGSYVERAKE